MKNKDIDKLQSELILKTLFLDEKDNPLLDIKFQIKIPSHRIPIFHIK